MKLGAGLLAVPIGLLVAWGVSKRAKAATPTKYRIILKMDRPLTETERQSFLSGGAAMGVNITSVELLPSPPAVPNAYRLEFTPINPAWTQADLPETWRKAMISLEPPS
jgi:hypothetical protein